MGDSRRLLLLLTAIILVRSSLQAEIECPQKCDCLEQYVDCSKKNFVSVPKIPKWVEHLDLSHNRLTGKDMEVLDKLLNLKVLKLDKNSLHHIPSFLNINQIQEISLNKNNITSINKGRFQAKSSITVLNLNHNHIQVIEEGALNNLTNLEVLKLNRNELQSLPNHLFQYQSKLRTLELNYNKFNVINGLLFQGLSNLTTLRMKFNNIGNMEDGAFFGFQSVNVLQLDHNKLHNISKGWMYGLESLTTLSLSNNLISKIDIDSWERCTNLRVLDLSHNHLIEIDGWSFQHLLNLQILNLSNNNISSISQEAFSQMSHLEALLLNNNKISWTVEDMSGPFSKLQSLINFNLASNHIKSINSRAFEGLSSLTDLDLRGNNITSIQQHAFESMMKLKRLHLNSSSLLCDCNTLWIVKWIKEKSEQKYVTATCAYPSEVRGMPISKLKEENCGDSPKPKVVEHPKKSHLAIKGRSANLVCSATSNPFSNMTFLWRKNNGNISNPSVFENTTITSSGQPRATSVLIIPNVTHADAGKYQCVVSNSFGTTYSTKARVNIVTFPRFIKSPVNVTVQTGETVTLNCAATGDPTPEISWKKDGGNDFPAARERRMNVMPTDHLFFIVNAKTTDMGIYSCAAKNPAGTIIANATLTVLQEPSFVRVMENKEVTKGESVVLQCMSSGSPKPALKWLKDGIPIVPTGRHYFAADDQLLVIIEVESSDAGRYECEITNDLGTKKDMTELRVLPPVAILVKEEDMTGIIIITVVCCAVGTSIIWVVIIYHTRRRMAGTVHSFPAESINMTQVVRSHSDSPQMFPDNISEHSSCKDSGTGDSAKQTSFDGVPTDRNDQVHFESAVCRSYSPVPEAHKLLPSSFKPSIQVCVNTSVTPATYSFSSHNDNV